MIYLVHILICLILVVVQTTVMPVLLPPPLMYDLLLPFVVYLGLNESPGRAVMPLLAAGLMMDTVSGGALGMYTLVYCWLYALIRLLINLIQRDSRMVFVLAIVAGVALEHAIFRLTGFFSGNMIPFGGHSLGSFTGRMITAGLTGPFVMRLFTLTAAKMKVRMRSLS